MMGPLLLVLAAAFDTSVRPCCRGAIWSQCNRALAPSWLRVHRRAATGSSYRPRRVSSILGLPPSLTNCVQSRHVLSPRTLPLRGHALAGEIRGVTPPDRGWTIEVAAEDGRAGSKFHVEFFEFFGLEHRGVAPCHHVGQRHNAVAITGAIAVELHVIGQKTRDDWRVHCIGHSQ